MTAMRRSLWALAACLLVGSGCGSMLSEEQRARALPASANAESTAAAADTAAPPSGEVAAPEVGAPLTGTPDGATAAATPATAAGTANPVKAATGTANPTGSKPSAAGGGGGAATAAAAPTAAGSAAAARSGTAGASSGQASAQAPGPSAATGGAGVAKNPIKLGSVGVANGPLGAVTGPVAAALRAWVPYTNARGGLNGHRVELIMIDDGGDPARAEAAARRLVEQDKVIAIFNDYMISEAPAVVRYLEQKNVPLITGACGCDAIFDTSSIVFNPIQGVSTGIANGFLVPPTKATDKKTVASLYCREATLCSVQEDLIRKRMADGFGGLKLVYEAQVSLAQPDFTAEVLEAKRAGAEILECLVDIQSCMRIAQAAHRQGYNPIFAGNWNLQDDKNALAAAKDLDGMVVPSRVPNWQTSPRMQFYREAMGRYQPGQVMGDGGASAFVVGALLDKVVSTLPPNPSSADLIAGLLALRGETLGGLLPPITFPKSADRSGVNVCNIPTVLKGGKFSAIDPSEAFVCGL